MSQLQQYQPFGTSINPFGSEFLDRLNAMGEAVGRLTAIEEPINRIVRLVVDESGSASTGRLHVARVTANNPDTNGLNATYKAQAIDDLSITVPKDQALFLNNDPGNDQAWVSPETRPVQVPPIDVLPRTSTDGPAGLGALCFIVIDTLPGDPPLDFHALFLWEMIDTAPCPSIAAASQQSVAERIAEIFKA